MKPTYLYIKQHTVTGKLYFGKTTTNPEKYYGSGVHWEAHINKHGKEHVVNLWYCLFYDEEQIRLFALNFSEQQNIVESDDWLNLTVENGVDGGSSKGRKLSESTKQKMSEARKGKPKSEQCKMNMKNGMTGKHKRPDVSISNSQKKGIPTPLKGIPQRTTTCPHCGKTGGYAAMQKWHFEKCKFIKDSSDNL